MSGKQFLYLSIAFVLGAVVLGVILSYKAKRAAASTDTGTTDTEH